MPNPYPENSYPKNPYPTKMLLDLSLAQPHGQKINENQTLTFSQTSLT